MKALRTEDLNNILQTNAVTRKSYLGTFPSCVFPKTNKQVYTFVSNTSDHLDTGEHWVCWFINGLMVLEFLFLIVMEGVRIIQHFRFISSHL